MTWAEILNHAGVEETVLLCSVLAASVWGCFWVRQQLRRAADEQTSPLDAQRLEHLLGARAHPLPSVNDRGPVRRSLDTQRLEIRLRGFS